MMKISLFLLVSTFAALSVHGQPPPPAPPVISETFSTRVS